MAKIGKYLEEDFIRPLTTASYLTRSVAYNHAFNGLEGAVFNRTIVADMSNSNEVEIPVAMRAMVETRILQDADMFVCNLLPRRLGNRTTRTAESTIRQLNTSSLGYGLHSIKNHKGGVYWGAPGLMLDENFNPLYIYVLRGSKSITDTYYVYNKGVLYVSPNVVLREDDIMYKAIKKKVIPIILGNEGSLVPYETRAGKASADFTTEVVIADLNRFIHRVLEPEDEDLNISLNALLNENIDNVLGNLLI